MSDFLKTTVQRIIVLICLSVSTVSAHQQMDESSELAKTFDQYHYAFLDCAHHSDILPRLQYNRVPKDFMSIKNVALKKNRFIQFLLPIIAQENERILNQRKHLLAIDEKLNHGIPLQETDKIWLKNREKEYRLKQYNHKELLKRMDTVPVSLILAQAAIESGWGTSRFAQTGNALFGQWMKGSSMGMTPKKREPGKSHVVQQFKKPSDSIRSYLLNLNTHPAYSSFRELRHKLRQSHHEPTGLELATELHHYSQMREQYVTSLQHLIRKNNLEACNTIQIANSESNTIHFTI